MKYAVHRKKNKAKNRRTTHRHRIPPKRDTAVAGSRKPDEYWLIRRGGRARGRVAIFENHGSGGIVT